MHSLLLLGIVLFGKVVETSVVLNTKEDTKGMFWPPLLVFERPEVVAKHIGQRKSEDIGLSNFFLTEERS